jgi:hypothetical protein
MSKEIREIRFISPEPRLALRLRERRPAIIPQDYYDWGTQWVSDVGSIMRTRSYMAGTVALYISYALIALPFTVFPELKKLKFLSTILGVT